MQKEILNDNTNVTANSQQLELLKHNFPQCFDKDGNFIVQKMEEIVGESGLELSKESYSLNWLGKSYARLLANENPRTLLKEDKVHNAKEQNKESQNLLIKGDNLEVLKHLSNAYAESIKMIYIDPPYNTGSDGFVYNDDRKFKPEELSRLAGIDIEESKRILEFTQSNANSHSAWLTFMYPRLYIARSLLKEDGVIFISIDDNEQAQLKLLCDEIFGEENFIADIIWEKKYTRANDAKWFSDNHDYILCYAKRKENFEVGQLPRTDEQLKAYKNPDSHPKGLWKATPLHAKSGTNTNPYIFANGTIFTPPKGTYRRYTDDTMKTMEENNEIWFGKDENQIPQRKSFLTEVKAGVTPITIWKYNEVGHNHEATTDMKNLGLAGIFSSPKPVRLIKQMMLLATSNKNNDFILDFFGGSGTTAHAVMDLNSDDDGNRNFITVQIEEPSDSKKEAYKAGYKTIFEITKARILKAAIKIKEKNPKFKGDLGFKIYETIPIWDGYMDEIDELREETTLFDGSKLNDEEIEVLLTTWKVHDGIELRYELNELYFADYKGYLGEETLYFVHTGFTTNALKDLIEKLDKEKAFEPSRIVLFGYNFTSKHQRELGEALRSYTNKKSIELDLIVRY
jgi:adenine-specific DNA-methyltransferase